MPGPALFFWPFFPSSTCSSFVSWVELRRRSGRLRSTPRHANQATRCHGRETRASSVRRLESFGRATHVPEIPFPPTSPISRPCTRFFELDSSSALRLDAFQAHPSPRYSSVEPKWPIQDSSAM
ncbi:uncharacterized protein CLUP02_03451 [Colletotrichum lupini]|uniref:Uncharacterized protein n=1 Tax=Colletotrichum lupini TaxID=145971 RepID=A0A9Q8WBT6_9PEZI|nr:uncharacterized protein CLUP02_03451 [Colletotrichum lupini]UQC77978.1 hypothetical protein CLUP02_03451 [Colletotrichum lupini]